MDTFDVLKEYNMWKGQEGSAERELSEQALAEGKIAFKGACTMRSITSIKTSLSAGSYDMMLKSLYCRPAENHLQHADQGI